MEYVNKNMLSDYEIERAKRRVYVELFQHETGSDISQAIGNHLLYFNRRVFRSEIAYRIAAIDKKTVIDCLNKWIINKKFTVTIWGNTDNYTTKE